MLGTLRGMTMKRADSPPACFPCMAAAPQSPSHTYSLRRTKVLGEGALYNVYYNVPFCCCMFRAITLWLRAHAACNGGFNLQPHNHQPTAAQEHQHGTIKAEALWPTACVPLIGYAYLVPLAACIVRTASSEELLGQACWIIEVASFTLFVVHTHHCLIP